MEDPAGNAQKLTDSSAQALEALINSLSPAKSSVPGEKLSVDQVTRLSDKLSHLVGNVVLDCTTEMRNDKGELVNEEGLPIIDITEPLQDADTTVTSVYESPLIADPELVPLTSLQEAEAGRRRHERDRILDLLEAEERRDKAMIENEEREERRAAFERQKNAPTFELEKLKAAKEMQKKMGKALLHNMVQAREREEKDKMRVLALDKNSEEKKKGLKPKKSVSFADLPPHIDDERTRDKALTSPKGTQLDWGDVSPARLRATNRHMLMTKAQIDKHPMKMDVVERKPFGAPLAEEPSAEQGDSDDESVPESLVPAESDDDEIIWSDHDHGDAPQPEAHSSDSDGDEEPEDEPNVEDEYDLDLARHQREIALEYYEKRGTIGEEVSEAMRLHTHEEVDDEWDREEVPLEATLSSPRPKPLISKFKASRIASSYNASAPSTSLGSSVLPASSSQTLQRAVRMGKLENDQLVQVQSDAEDEAQDETMRGVLELLKKGEVQNIGPQHISLSQPTSSNPKPPSIPSLEGHAPPTVTKLKTSKFKLTRPQRQPSPLSPTTSESQPATPASYVHRSSPKLSSSPIDVVEYQPPSSSSVLPREPQTASHRPSILMEATASLPSLQTPCIIDSPSFRRPAHIAPRSPITSPPYPTTVCSFQPESNRGPSRLDRPPTVMSSTVHEFTRRGTGAGGKDMSEACDTSGGKKVSRFLGERM